ncbi:hypothetical protein [Engelhardtia mirabilis]|uniref:NHL repeat protein n=1 Tax=Engelhardtia mirabilis TaxID=2528011 RepID=A0A518BLE6_9BACT|nr:hypothetical protein Pla133_28880 [Planctomycetes bacterium Pla133]QDV02125.1 hypothetical protein Pla86_28870 [Planctomycetes bacterium Pla86]
MIPDPHIAALTLTGALLAAPCGASPATQSQLATTVSGQVVDLIRDSDGRLLYCTTAGDVGRIEANGSVTLLVTAVSGAFPNPLRALHPTPDGQIAVIDQFGEIWHVPPGGGAPVLVYDNLYLINDPTDLIVDASGNHVAAVATISSGYRALAWVDVSGPEPPSAKLWSYYLVANQPLAIAPDPQTGGLLLADATAGGLLQALTTGTAPVASLIDGFTVPGIGSSSLDGDLATEVDGSAYWIAGPKLLHHDRFAGTTNLIETGSAPRRGLAIAPSSSGSGSSTGFSVWIAQGNGPTEIRELIDAGAPAPLFADSLGQVPSPGEHVLFHSGLNVFCMASEPDGSLLVGGDLWGSLAEVRRIDPATGTVNLVASDANGLDGRIEGLSVQPDSSILALTFLGRVRRIQENPLSVTKLFEDPGDQIVVAKGLAAARDGRSYLAERAGYAFGHIWEVENGSATVLATSTDSRGVVGDPFTNTLLASEWGSAGFGGRVAVVDETNGELDPFGIFDTLNFANGHTWGDGDLLVDCMGGVYTSCEDEFAVYRYDRFTGAKVRVGSGYLNRPAGMALAPSRPGTPSDTGWSLYVTEWNNLWEIPHMPAPAPSVLDRDAPVVGAPVGFLPPQYGAARFALADPAGAAAIVGTDAAHLLRLPLDGSPATILAGPAEGLVGDLVAGVARASGELYIANAEGIVFSIGAGSGWQATVAYSDTGDQIHDLRGLALRDTGDMVILDRSPMAPAAARIGIVSGGSITDWARSAGGESLAISPLSGDLYVSQQGKPGEVRGELLRVTLDTVLARAGHVLPSDLGSPRGYSVGDGEGELCFTTDGILFVLEGDTGRVQRFDTVLGDSAVFAGGYAHPTGLFLAPGTPGVAGPQGTSLFVLDGYALYEHGVSGLPVPAQSRPTGGGSAIDMNIAGLVDFGGFTPFGIDHPAAAGQTYFVLPGFSGKGDGFPLAVFGDTADPRILPLSLDPLWFQFLLPPTFVDFQGVLDGAGKSPPSAGLSIPADPGLQSAGIFMDMFWITIDFSSPNGVTSIGGTTQLFFGP